jgi:hypothetical protein
MLRLLKKAANNKHSDFFGPGGGRGGGLGMVTQPVVFGQRVVNGNLSVL